MKRYKLLKDLPTIKAGEIFKEMVTGYNEKNLLVRIAPLNAKSPRLKVQDIDNFDEWFEEIQEPTDDIHWKPRIGDRCFILENTNIRPALYTGMLRDYNAWRTGKVFRTEEECEKALDRELAEVRLRRTSTFKPDFENDNGGWVVYYDPRKKRLEVQEVYRLEYGEIVRYQTKKEAEKSIKENEKDWLTYFGVEDC
jgi:hypothetical protein